VAATTPEQTEDLGSFIRLERQLADLSLRRLAEMTNVSNAYLSQIERGMHQPSLRILRAIADALDLSADVLLAKTPMRKLAPSFVDTESAIRSDPHLTPDQRAALLATYRCFRALGIPRGARPTGKG
jgi:transcriptional regulator with XRE-family HTH domain